MSLTFIVPIYNPDLTLLKRCIKSLVDQSLKSWDAVFVLDGSSLAAREVIGRAMKKSPNHFKILEQEHSGVQKARNLGGAAATGDYLCFWDCDCLIEPETAKTWLEMFDKYPEIGFVYSGYTFLNEQGAINSEPFDPWTLRVRNYVSTCFPLRRKFYPGWNESLKSLQDWDYWLSAVEKGAVGKYLAGYAFATAYPTQRSISGQGCTRENWLDRVDAVKRLHNLPERNVCVSSLGSKNEGIWLAKLLDADYQDLPNAKPHKYKTIIQLGFSFLPGHVEHHCSIFNEKDVKKIIFWTCDNVTEVCTRINLTAAWKYSALLNGSVLQFVEDKAAYDLMRRAGFAVEIMPLPVSIGEQHPLPKRPKFAVDIDTSYNFIFEVLQKSLPDVDLEQIRAATKLDDVSGLAHFHPDRTVSIAMKRAILAGRSVVSNVQAPFMGYVDDTQNIDGFIKSAVGKIRELAYQGPPASAVGYYTSMVSPNSLKELINA